MLDLKILGWYCMSWKKGAREIALTIVETQTYSFSKYLEPKRNRLRFLCGFRAAEDMLLVVSSM